MITLRRIGVVACVVAMAITVHAQAAPSATATSPQASPVMAPALNPAAPTTDPLQPLRDFRDADIKFNLGELMSNLRDNRHEGWVLAAYPDPKTSRPLIGAGFSLDLPVRVHPQSDPLNPNQFLEPSSAQLWQAAGLDSAKLQSILDQYDEDLEAWRKTKFRRKIRTQALTPEISEEDATQLLRISAIQAIHNARAYCRSFDQLTGPQQMALSQLVFQMGVNLEEFTHFLGAINGEDASLHEASLSSTNAVSDAEHWKTVQSSLIQSDWARRYSSRAVAVIAMFDPEYAQDPVAAEREVRLQVHPYHHRRRATLRTASAHKRSATRRTHQS